MASIQQSQTHLKLQEEAIEEVEHEIEQQQLFLSFWVLKVNIPFSLIVELEPLFSQVVAFVDEFNRQDGRVGETTCESHPTFEV